MIRRTVIIRMPDTVDMSIYRSDGGLSGNDMDIFNMLKDINATWVENRMPGTKVWANKQLVLMRVDSDLANLQALFSTHTSPAWIIKRMRQIKKHLIVDGNGDPILDGEGNLQYEIVHDLKSDAMDNQIKQFMVSRKDELGDDIPYTGIVRLPYHDNADERDYPETVDFG